MANTALLNAVVQTLMQGRNPSPLAPVPTAPPGGFMPFPIGPPPEPAPVAPAPALDQSLIEQLTGPRPVAPVEQPVSLLQKIALALQGFGAGVQGQGPQFLANLQQQRERPMREFQAQTEAFEDRRRRATVFAEEKRQREQADIQRRADIQSNREFQQFELEERNRMQEARDLRLQAAALEREEVKARAEIAEQQRKEKAQQERDARLIARDFGKVGAQPRIAKELGDYYAGKTDALSSQAAKFESAQARLAEIRANRAAAGGTGGGGGADKATAKLVAEFNQARENLVTAVARGDAKAQKELRLRLDQLVRRLAGRPGVEAGYGAGQWPYVKVNGVLSTPETGQQQAAQPQAQAATAQNKDPFGVR